MRQSGFREITIWVLLTSLLAACGGGGGGGTSGGGSNNSGGSLPPPLSATTLITTMVSTGWNGTAAVQGDGSVAQWGGGFPNSPTITSGISGVVAISSGANFVTALKSDGTVWTWGENGHGELGNGTTTTNPRPAMVPGLTGVVSVSASAGGDHVLALKSDGTVVTWGWNGYGQLGDGTLTDRSTPALIPGLSGVVAVSAGSLHSVALKSDGTVVWWGGVNFYGLQATPNLVVVPGLNHVVAISAGDNYTTLALKDDGTVVAWGYYAVLGAGGGNSALPTVVAGVTNVTAIAAGYSHYLALKSDGSLLVWGFSNYGSFGDGTSPGVGSVYGPVVVPGVTDAVQVSAGFNRTAVVRRDGTQLAWGLNTNGQLGDGTNTTQLSAVAVLPVKRRQSIGSLSFSPSTLSVGGTSVVSATSTSGLTVSFSTGTPLVCSVTGSTITATASGVCKIVANQAGSVDYAAAIPQFGTINIGSPAGGLAGTWCTDVGTDQNCWVFDNNTGSTTGSFYQQSINQYSGTLTETMTWSVQGGNLTYQFTRSTLTNSGYDYSIPISQQAYTFPYTLNGNLFTFQGIVFTRK